MKNLFAFLITTTIGIFISAGIFLPQQAGAQSPEKMSYQAVLRDGSNNLVTSTNVGMRIQILQGSQFGAAVYVETHTPSTSSTGLVSIEIGTGKVVSGNFSAIDWTDGPYFLKTETDMTGGTNYSLTTTSQLLSVPYALHAKTAETVTGDLTETDPVFGASLASEITGTDTTNWNNKQGQLPEGDDGDVLVWNGSNWVADNNQLTISDSSVVMNNSFSLSDGFYLAYNSTNTISFVNDHSYIQVYPNGIASNRIVYLADGETNGQIIILACHRNTGTHGFRLLSSGNIKLNGGGHLDLYPNDTVMLIWNGESWTEISRSDN